jgi:ribose transport system substrate-binding protein
VPTAARRRHLNWECGSFSSSSVSDDQLVKFLQDGTIVALVVQDPFRMGYDGVKIALAASKGEQVPASVDTGATVITKANMNSARSQELLNPMIGGRP